MSLISWKRGFLSAELSDSELHSIATLDRPFWSGGWELVWKGEKYRISRPHLFAREYTVTREPSGETVARVYIPLVPFRRRRVARIALMPEQQVYTLHYTNFWRRHFRLEDPGGQACVQTENVSPFGWTGTLNVENGTPELVALLAYFAYLRMTIRRRAARS